jgi:hypothetical protein
MQMLRKSILAISLLAAGLVAFIATPRVTYAQSVLAAEQVVEIQAAVQAVIDAVNEQIIATQDERDAAMANAIASVTVNLIATYGTTAAEEISLLVVTSASEANIAGHVIGAGLGQAATQIAESDPVTAARIAAAVGSGGVAGMLAAFNQTVVAYGRSELVTSITAVPVMASPSSCDNPSCT